MEEAVNKRPKWLSIPADVSSFSATDFDSFGGIEELTDYTILKANRRGKIKKTESVSQNKGKKGVTRCQKKKGTSKSSVDAAVEKVVKKRKLDMSAWCNCFVPSEILTALQELGFDKPTEIQELCLPHAIRDHQDILAAAETGSGKTLAFGIPILTHLLNQRTGNVDDDGSDEEENHLKGLILLPTRELAIQVKNHLEAVSKYLDIKFVSIVGGLSEEKQKRQLQKSPDIVIATPGRLWQLMEENQHYLKQIPSVKYLVIDEADRMVEKGHFEELTKILELMNDPRTKKERRRQTFVFSATLTMVHDLPKRFEMNKKKKNKNIQKHKLDSLMKMVGIREKPKVIDITRKTGMVETLTESQIYCSMEEKDTYLYYFVLMYPGRTLVFCNSINCVRRLKSVFEQLGCQPLTLHASMQQRQRFKNLDKFASSQNSLLLATDVAARGLDIKGIEHVVHFQVPRTAEIYVHRSGRTARAKNDGLSLMLIEPQEITYYRRICKNLNKDKVLPTFPIDQAILKIVKERVKLARHIDQLQHREQRLAAQNRWFLKTAEEMDIDVEDDEQLLNEMGDEKERSTKARQIKTLKKQLLTMTNSPLVPRKFTGSYPTKSGKLLKPTSYGTGNALKVFEKDASFKLQTLQKIKKKQRYRRRK